MKKSKYRIKIHIYKNGRKEYFPQVKIGWAYSGIAFVGEAMVGNYKYDSREKALNVIDKHFEGNSSLQNIEFEYIEK